jgi:hypothetical protein
VRILGDRCVFIMYILVEVLKSTVYTFFSQLTNLPGSKLNDLGCLDCLFFAAYCLAKRFANICKLI